ncbi:MAG: protein kinase [Lentisphaeria bacterium]|nr:protein kinase [Lentisphaeria bacterium]
MAVVLRCSRCEKDHEVQEKNLGLTMDCPHCNNEGSIENFSVVMFCPHCYAELLVPPDVIKKELQCPFCDKVFHANITFSLNDDDDDTEEEAVADDSSPMFKEGDVYDKYRIVKLLGKGGMGEVYLASHMLLHREIALKIMTNDIAVKNPVYAKRFIREAKLANRIDSENFITVYDVGKEVNTNTLYIAMEYVHGRNVSEIMKAEGTFKEKDILNIALKIAEVLIILERENIVHRDIKPSNIMISSSNVVKLADFGIAKSGSKGENELTLTQGNIVFGTPNYASPEQCRSSHNVDSRSDIYSLGATMFHMAAGQPPYGGTTAMETIIKVLNEEHKDLSKIADGFSANFILLVNDMLNRDPDKRPQNAEILKMRIEALLSGRKKFMEIVRSKSAVLKSQIALVSSSIYNFIRGRMKKIPGKSVKKFFKTFFKIAFIIACIFLAVKYRQKIISGASSLYKTVLKSLNINQTPPPPPEAPAAPVPKVETEVPKVEVPKEPEVKVEKVKKAPGKKTVRKKRKPRTMEEINKVEKKKEFTSPDRMQMILNARLEKCNRELTALLHDETSFADRKWFMERVKFYQKLQATLFKQFKDRQKAFEILNKKKSFNAVKTTEVQRMVNEYSKNANRTSFTSRDRIFAQQLLQYLKNPATDPNMAITDAAHPEFSGPLLRWIEHAHIPLKKELEKELLVHYVSTECIIGDCTLELCKYGVPKLDGMLFRKIKAKKYNDAIELINYGANVNEQDAQGRTPLHWAIFHDNLPLVRQLLLAGADTSLMTRVELQTPIFYAVKYASKEIFDLLKAVGADEEFTDVNNCKAKHYAYFSDFRNALFSNDHRQVKSLLEKYPELCNLEITGGILPLQYSCAKYQSRIVLDLLQAGANPNLKASSQSETPLQIAYEYAYQRKLPEDVRRTRWGIFNSLLINKADPKVKPLKGQYPTMLQYSCSEIYKIDKLHMGFISSLIENSDITDDIMPVLKKLYEHKIVRYTDDRHVPLRSSILKLMMLKKIDLNRDMFEDLIPSVAWSPKITEDDIALLLENGARINGKDKNGRNALFYLCEWAADRDLYIDAEANEKITKRIKFLRSKGIDMECSVDGRTVRDLSIPEMMRPALK